MEKLTVKLTIIKKRNVYYALLCYKNNDGKLCRTVRSTGLKAIPGNKRLATRKAEELQSQLEYELNNPTETNANTTYFCDFLLQWLDMKTSQIEATTLSGYHTIINNILYPYFKKIGVPIDKLKPLHIQNLYTQALQSGTSANTIRHYHTLLKQALKFAIKMELLDSNPADKVDLPKKEQYIANYYNKDEIEKLLVCSADSDIYVPIVLATIFGLRREEALGLRWSSVDFVSKSICIEFKRTKGRFKDSNNSIVNKKSTKTHSSYRTLPMDDNLKNFLMAEKEKQEKNKQFYGNCYQNEHDFVCVTDDGKPFHPDTLTRKFKKLLQDNNLKIIRFHDLRHSCASLLVNQHVPMSNIQHWLGHSNYSTTANIYAHVDSSSNTFTSEVLSNTLSLESLVT